MMRLSISTRGVALVSFIFLSFQVYAVKYEKVPSACEQVLRNLDKRFKVIEPLNSTVDWSAIKDGMRAVGYPDSVIRNKLYDLDWDADIAKTTIRVYSGNPHWQWGEELSAKQIRNIASNQIRVDDYKLLEMPKYDRDQIIATLPYWHSLKGFDAAEFVYAYLLEKEREGNRVSEDEMKSLMQFAPIWLSGSRALINAKRIYGSLANDGNLQLLVKHLSRRQQSAFMKFVRTQVRQDYKNLEPDYSNGYEDEAMKDIRFTSILPWRVLPANVKKSINEMWGVDLKKYPPITIDSIHMVGNNSYQDAGNCEMMTNGHMNSLGMHLDPGCKNEIGQEEWKESILIRVNGVLVGSLKLVGDPSMLALRNVMDSSGRLILAMGGVYHIEKNLYREIEYMGRNRNGRWRTVNVDSLGVHPHTYMLNDNAWTDTNKYQMIKVLGEAVSREDLFSIIRDLMQNEEGFLNDGDKQQLVVQQTMKAIDRIRKKLE